MKTKKFFLCILLSNPNGFLYSPTQPHLESSLHSVFKSYFLIAHFGFYPHCSLILVLPNLLNCGKLLVYAVPFLLSTALPLSPPAHQLCPADSWLFHVSALYYFVPNVAPEVLPIASIASLTSSAKELTTFYCYDLFTFLNPIGDVYYESQAQSNFFSDKVFRTRKVLINNYMLNQ